MVERINLLLKAKNITARQFAEAIGIQPSGMSHILSGRNNPSLDFVMKVVKRWPEININWLMFGKGEMFVGLSGGVPNHDQSIESGLVQSPAPEPVVPYLSEVESSSEVLGESSRAQEYDLFSQPSVESVSQTPKQQSDSAESSQFLSAQSEPSKPQSDDVREGTKASSSFKPKVAATVSDLESFGAVASVDRSGICQSEVESSYQSQPNEICLNGTGKPTELPQPILAKKKIVKVIILYEDHSFAEYHPE